MWKNSREPFCLSHDFHIFSVPVDLMGLAIGTQGSNIQSARKIEGVKDIVVQDSHSENAPAVFKVYADSPEAAQKARETLEYGVDQIEVERDFVGKIIGKSGKTIQVSLTGLEYHGTFLKSSAYFDNPPVDVFFFQNEIEPSYAFILSI